jgi:hypothetical protein
MLQQLKATARPYATLFALALVVAVEARVGLAIMDSAGTLSYDYISASNVPLLEVICSILTGSTLVAFLFTAGLVLLISTAGAALFGLLYWQDVKGAGRAGLAFIWGWATALVAIICALIVSNGILSGVQLASMSSKLPPVPVLVLAMVLFAAFIGTLLAAAAEVVCACIAKSRSDSKKGRRKLGLGLYLVIAAAVCGLAVMLLTISSFSALNSASIDTGTLLALFGIDIVVNLVILFVARALVRRAQARAV